MSRGAAAGPDGFAAPAAPGSRRLGGRRRAGHGAALLDGRGHADAGDLGQHADLVVPPAAPRHRALPEVGVRRVVDDAVLAGGLEGGGLRLAQDAVPPVDQRVHVRVDRVGGGHHEDARAGVAHLVLVQPHGGEPVLPQQRRRQLALLLGEHVHVAVVVVADVRVVEVRHRAGLELGAEVLVEPVDHHDLAVRVGARDEHQDHVVEDLLHDRRVVGRQPMHEFDRHLRRADLGRVQVAGDDDDRLARGEDVVAFGRARRPALEVQLSLQLFEAVEAGHRVGRADLDGDERVALRGLAEFAHLHPRRAGGDVPHVLDDLVVANELVVGADGEPDERVGADNRGGPGGLRVGSLERDEQDGGEQRGGGDEAASVHVSGPFGCEAGGAARPAGTIVNYIVSCRRCAAATLTPSWIASWS